MNLEMLSNLAARWMSAKQSEKAAIEYRRALEDEMVDMMDLDPAGSGVVTHKVSGLELKTTQRLNKKIDSALLQEIALEHGISHQLSSLFNWKPSVVEKTWNATDSSITQPLLAAITATPGRPTFTIKEK